MEQAVMAQGEQLAQESAQVQKEMYEGKLAEQMTALVELIDGVEACEVRVVCEDSARIGEMCEVKSVEVGVRGAEKYEEKIRRVVGMYYQLTPEMIEVREL